MKPCTFILLLCVASVELNAQLFTEGYLSVSYDVNVPLVNKNFVGNVSSSGLQIGYRERINDNFFAGVDFSAASYRDYSPRQTYFSESGAITTDVFKYVSTYGLTLSGDYLFSPAKRLTPFAGLGLGAMNAGFKTYYNVYSASDNSWGFLLRPQGGVMMKVGVRQAWGLTAAVHYDYATSKSDTYDYKAFSSFGIRVGAVFTVR